MGELFHFRMANASGVFKAALLVTITFCLHLGAAGFTTNNPQRKSYLEPIRNGLEKYNLLALPERPRTPGEKSVVLTLWDSSLSDQVILNELLRVEEMGFESVVIPVFPVQTSKTSDDPGVKWHLPIDFAKRQARLALNMTRLQVSFIPILSTINWEWRGYILPKNVKVWFLNYANVAGKLVELANEFQSPEIILATELEKIYSFNDEWIQLVKETRKSFSGRIIITANWSQYDYGFWRHVDAIGISLYAPLATGFFNSSATYKNNALNFRNKLINYARRVSKPIHLTEIGFGSHQLAAKEPYTYSSRPGLTLTPDPNLQAECFKIILSVWENVRDVIHQGVWSTGLTSIKDYSTNHDFRGKPAEKVLREWLAKDDDHFTPWQVLSDRLDGAEYRIPQNSF
ncbi:MAG: hypothetical protein COT74_07745 [Bdellovibrionales bacterium CG10_big_fil_rev_8_21_14_0_10_45_34]|nr:MAG: hypothetical protein COT74_07745 [Bdellovibrionales bacterium CG10_big_fil_rev_8_21_14_0_10_45_34]